MSETTRLHNPGATELVYDGRGHVLAVGESAVVSGELDAVTRRLLDTGRLIVARDPSARVLSLVKEEPEPEPVEPVKKRAPRRKASGVTQKGKI